jgi:histone H1/5
MQQEALPQSATELSRPRTGKRRIAALLLAVAGAAYLVCDPTPIASTIGFAQGVLRPSMPSALAPAVDAPPRISDVFMGARAPAKKPVAKKPVATRTGFFGSREVKKPVAKKPVAKKPAPKKPVAKKPVPKKKVVSRNTRNQDKGKDPLIKNTIDILKDFFFKPRDEMATSRANRKPRR